MSSKSTLSKPRLQGRVQGRGYTLVEVLVVVTIMGILGALVVPSVSTVGSFRVQSAVRTLVSDITFAQSDAMAFQTGRALMFFPDENRYVVVEVTGPTLDEANDILYGSGREDGRFEKIGRAHV